MEIKRSITMYFFCITDVYYEHVIVSMFSESLTIELCGIFGKNIDKLNTF